MTGPGGRICRRAEAPSVLGGVAPGKLVENGLDALHRSGRIRAIAGASGGPRIISATLQVLLGLRYWGRTAAEAVRHPRLHHQWLPDEVAWEANSGTAHDLAGLEALGHRFADRSRDLAVVQAIRVEDAGFEPASDPRKGGAAAGY